MLHQVNSHQLNDVALQSPPDSEWPYSVPTPTTYASSVPRITSDPSQYALANANMVPPSTTGPYLSQGNGRAPIYSDVSSIQYPIVPTRQPFTSTYHANLDNSIHQYDLQPSHNVYPLQNSQAPSPGFSTPDPSHHWTPLSSNSRQLYHNMGWDQDASSSYAPSNYLYSAANVAPLTSVTSEGSSMFPGLSPLGTHLPSHGGANRILPNPTGLHSSLDSSNGSAQDGDSEIGIMQHQSRDSWDLSRIATGTSQGSVSSAAPGSVSVSGPPSSNASSSPGDTTGFGYLPMTHSSVDESVGSNPGFGAVTNTTGISNPEISATSGPQSNPLVNSQHPGLNSSFTLYGSHGSAATNVLQPAEGVLASSQSHSRILQPQPRHSPSYDLLSGSFNTNPPHARKILRSNAKGH